MIRSTGWTDKSPYNWSRSKATAALVGPEPMREDTKLARIREAMRAGNWDEAVTIASRFQRLGEEAEVISRAANAIKNPDIYKELGYDPAELKEQGIAALKRRYSKSWDEIVKPESDDGQ